MANIRVEKLNITRIIPESEKEKFLAQGYIVTDEKGIVVETGNKDLEQLKEENKRLEAENKALKAQIKALKKE